MSQYTTRTVKESLGGYGIGFLYTYTVTVYDDGTPVMTFQGTDKEQVEEQAREWIENQRQSENIVDNWRTDEGLYNEDLNRGREGDIESEDEDIILEECPVIEYDTPTPMPPPPPSTDEEMGREAAEDWESLLATAIRDPDNQNFYDAVDGQSYNEWPVSREAIAVYESTDGNGNRIFIIILPRPTGSGYIMAYLYADVRPPEWSAPVIWTDQHGRERSGALDESELQEMMEWAEDRGARADKTTSAFIEAWQKQSGHDYVQARVTFGKNLTQAQIDELKAAGEWEPFQSWVAGQVAGFQYELSENGRYAQLWQSWVTNENNVEGGMNVVSQEGGPWMGELWKEWGEAGNFPSWAYSKDGSSNQGRSNGGGGGGDDGSDDGAWDWRTVLDEEHGKITAFGGLIVAGLLIFALMLVLRRRGDGK